MSTKPVPLRAAMSRRTFLRSTGLVAGAAGFVAAPGLRAFAAATSEAMRPKVPYGVQSGDISVGRAIVWSKTDRPARMIVECATNEAMRGATRVVGPAALPVTDYTARVDLTGLPPGEEMFYRVTFEDLSHPGIKSEPVAGRLISAPAARRNIRFVWSGDTAGQGYGINPDWGGMKLYEVMRRKNPEFFIHSGDTIYADGPLEAEKKLPDGTVWKNIVIPEKMKVAETLKEFRGNFAYNLMDANVRRFNAEVPGIYQWDDHETSNNWYPGEILDAPRYKERSASLLSARANRAFLEYTPTRLSGMEPERVYRRLRYGPQLEIFMIDMRSYRGPNSPNRQEEQGPETAFLGSAQIAWLKRALLDSRATWKIIGSDMPLGIIVGDGDKHFENVANGDGPALGRELELAGLLRFIKDNDVKNVVWLTADVHYSAAHYYNPARAQFSDFNPFWEFVTGPLNAGTFGPNKLDNTFGPEVRFKSVPDDLKQNTPPTAGYQFFGMVEIDGKTDLMTVSIHDLAEKELYKVRLEPEV